MTAPATVKCPACGAQTSGKFCAECGAPLKSRACPSCGAKLSARAKFCSECGTPTGAATVPPFRRSAPGGADRLPWIVAGIAVVALIVTIIVVVTKSPSLANANMTVGPTQGIPDRATTDLSQLTPEEQADRLFNRIMQAHEGGDTAQVQFFAPMALQAYANLPALDMDSRLHVGLIQLAAGDAPGALAQADTIQRASRTHLFGWYLRARAGQAQGNTAATREAFRAFLDNYAPERAKSLPEYQQHAQILSETEGEARRAMAVSTRP